MSSQVSA